MEEQWALHVVAPARYRPLLQACSTVLQSCSKRRSVLVAGVLALSFLPAALVVRGYIERRAYAVAQRSVSALGAWAAKRPVPAPDEEEFLPLLPHLAETSRSALGKTGVVAQGSHPGRRQAQGVGPKWAAPPILPEPMNHHASAEQVLRWVSARMMPVGRTREAAFGLPAGIELSGVSGLGIGLLDGDRLVSVDGVPVSKRAEVISLVLSARGRHQPKLVATLGRRTPAGPRTFSVVVDQPYPSVVGQVAARHTDSGQSGGAAAASPATVPVFGAPARIAAPD